MSFISRTRAEYLEMLRQELEDATREEVREESEVEYESETDAEPYQTFPTYSSEDIVVKQDFDLTCGMRCLQNMYGAHIVTREEMDNQAIFLENEEAKFADYVDPKYDPKLGDYSIEVLQSILEKKSKWAQRIDIQKFPSEYFVPTIECNPTFVGYIVALPGHYVVVKHTNNVYKCMDSLKGVATRIIDKRMLFKQRGSQLFCSQDTDDTRPVVALVAVGGSPFVEYSLLHNSWSVTPPSADKYVMEIQNVLRPNLMRNLRIAAKEVTQWYQKWKSIRVPPSETTIQHLSTVLRERISDECTIIVKRGDDQAAIRCSSVEGLMKELLNMQWVAHATEFYFQLNSVACVDECGSDLDLQAEGSLQEFGLSDGCVITLHSHLPQEKKAAVGGFYSFECKIEGTCIGQQHNSYSVRDNDGKVHVVYKKCIQNISKS